MLFKDYLKYQKQRVVLRCGSSHWTSIKAGVPQGSILGPLVSLYTSTILYNVFKTLQ